MWQPPYSYNWRNSTDGFNWSMTRGTNETYSEYLPNTGFNYYYLRLTVTSSDGQISDAFLTIYIDYSGGGGRLSASAPTAPIAWKEPRAEGSQPTEVGLTLTASPNPVQDELTVEFNLPRRSRVTLELRDSFGRSLRTLTNETFAPGTHRQTASLVDLPAGWYGCVLRTDEKSVAKSVLVVR